jgi:hypothetical protein
MSLILVATITYDDAKGLVPFLQDLGSYFKVEYDFKPSDKKICLKVTANNGMNISLLPALIDRPIEALNIKLNDQGLCISTSKRYVYLYKKLVPEHTYQAWSAMKEVENG